MGATRIRLELLRRLPASWPWGWLRREIGRGTMLGVDVTGDVRIELAF